jgi:hypothetical protein
MDNILFKVNIHQWNLSYRIKEASHNVGRETEWNIGPVNKYEAQSAIIPFVGIIIRKNISYDNSATSFLLVGLLRHRKKADFSR